MVKIAVLFILVICFVEETRSQTFTPAVNSELFDNAFLVD
jgi:hypothetical protein